LYFLYNVLANENAYGYAKPPTGQSVQVFTHLNWVLTLRTAKLHFATKEWKKSA